MNEDNNHRGLFYLALFTTVATLILIGLGNVVTRTQSGLGCGDHWPTCNGVWIPDLTNPHVTIEFLHRVLAAGVGVLALALTIASWRVRNARYARTIRNLSVGALIVLAIQIVIGGVAVRLRLPPAVIILHNGVSIAFFGVLVFLTARISQLHGTTKAVSPPPANPDGASRPLVPLLTAIAGLIYAQILLGAYVRQSGSRTGCTDMIPFCQDGRILPPPAPEALTHFAHRTFGVIVAAALIYLAVRVVWSGQDRTVCNLAISECVLVGLQVISGLMSVWTADRALVLWSTVHLVNASLMLGLVLFLLVRVKPVQPGPVDSRESFAVES